MIEVEHREVGVIDGISVAPLDLVDYPRDPICIELVPVPISTGIGFDISTWKAGANDSSVVVTRTVRIPVHHGVHALASSHS